MRGDPLIRALGFLGLRRRPALTALALGVGGSLSALFLAALSAWLITRAWQMPPVLYLSVAITAVRARGISRGVFRYLERLATHDLALQAMATARQRVYRRWRRAHRVTRSRCGGVNCSTGPVTTSTRSATPSSAA